MNEKNIVEITSEDLIYLNEDGEKQTVDFAACYQNYLNRWNDPDNIRRFKAGNSTFSDEELDASLDRIRAKKEVGWRDFSVPYIEFYTEPPIRFDFSNVTEFHKVEGLVRKAGWRTYDGA